MRKYGINAVFTVVKPFDFDGPDAGRLKTDDNGNMIAIDLYKRFHRVWIDDVVQSSRWFQYFGDDASWFEGDLEYSLAYFEKNTEPALYARVYGDMLRYNTESHDGLLLFKIICNETSTTKESNRRVMITIIKTYQIKSSCKGEVISNVVDLLLRAISNTMAAIYDDVLPEDYAQQIITIFTTTSVPFFSYEAAGFNQHVNAIYRNPPW